LAGAKKTTARRTSTRTLADLIRAMDNKRVAAITYHDADGGETLRSVENHDIRTTGAGGALAAARLPPHVLSHRTSSTWGALATAGHTSVPLPAQGG
jgi:hypothetical protein